MRIADLYRDVSVVAYEDVPRLEYSTEKVLPSGAGRPVGTMVRVSVGAGASPGCFLKVTVAAGGRINGRPSYRLMRPYEVVDFTWTGVEWRAPPETRPPTPAPTTRTRDNRRAKKRTAKERRR